MVMFSFASDAILHFLRQCHGVGQVNRMTLTIADVLVDGIFLDDRSVANLRGFKAGGIRFEVCLFG